MKTVKIKIFSTELHIYGPDEKAAFEEYSVPVTENICGMQCHDKIWIGDNRPGVIAHEATHFIDWLFEVRLGCKLGGLYDNSELRAYAVEHVVDCVHKYLGTECQG